jgi:predicted lipoprotein with Yx(FWY)xxD motif
MTTTTIQSLALSATRLAFFTLIAAVTATTAQAQPVAKDGVLTDAAGRTLYTFDKDQANKSNCQGPCLANWPPFVAAAPTPGGAKPASAIGQFEHDGLQHWTYNGSPLYYFAGDSKPGDRNGDGKGGVWHVVKPGAASAATTPAASGSAY